MEDNFGVDPLIFEPEVEDWVMALAEEWRDHYTANYEEKHDEYYRLWRGIWASEDKTRGSERSRIISPALQQAVESSVAEIEEATFGRGKWFDIKDDYADQETQDIAVLKKQLMYDFKKCKIRKAISEVLINAAVFGNGIAEVTLEDVKDMKPATQPIMDGQMTAVGVQLEDRFVVKLRPIMPRNFLIDPVATCIEDAQGVIIDEFVSKHSIDMLIEDGTYNDIDVGIAAVDTDLEPDKELLVYEDNKVRLTKYYGLVPTDMLKRAGAEVEDSDKMYTEAIVVLGNGKVLKAEQSPYMMQDRPIVAFSWDVVPSRFWGRGVCEKGYNSQKALDAEIRARIDALALTIHPMMAMDATRIPRGHRPEVKPGKMLLTNGDPREAFLPFNFGQVNQITFAQADALQKMVQASTGAVDSVGTAGQVNGEATAAGISMSLGAIIKRHKRTLVNFQDSFLIPFIEKAAWRYMQFEPERYPVKDYSFCAESSLGIIAREYEVTQLVQLLQTMPPDSPAYPAILEAIVDNMNLSNSDQIKEAMKPKEPDPQQQQMQMQAMQLEMQMQQSQIGLLQAQAQESQARAQKAGVEAQLEPRKVEIDKIKAVSANMDKGDGDEKEFQRKLKVAELALKEREIKGKENIAKLNAKQKAAADKAKAGKEDALMKKLDTGKTVTRGEDGSLMME